MSISINERGDCHNGISGCFATKASNKACARGFYPCTTRFPIEKIFHAGAGA